MTESNDDDDVERFVYLQRLNPEKKNAYIDAHEDVPSGVTDAMKRGGVKNFELYIRDNIAVCILETDDLDEYSDTIEGNKSITDWEKYTSQFKQTGVDADAPPQEGIPFMNRVWQFTADEVNN